MAVKVSATLTFENQKFLILLILTNNTTGREYESAFESFIIACIQIVFEYLTNNKIEKLKEFIQKLFEASEDAQNEIVNRAKANSQVFNCSYQMSKNALILFAFEEA